MSKFRSHIWEPIRYINFDEKQPKDMLCPAKFLGIAEDSGDGFTYYIRTESRHPKMLIRSNIKSRRVNIGKENERVSNEPQDFSFWLDKFVDGPSKPSSVIIEESAEPILPPHPETAIPPGNPPSDFLMGIGPMTSDAENKKMR